jgi:hypothetical protein
MFKELLNKKKSFKRKIYLVLIIIFVGTLVFGYFWFVKANNSYQESIKVIEQARKFNIINSEIESERDRCEKFVVQGEGDFSSFEYCKKFINWTDKISTNTTN